jgi:endonuclease YncB( thermonuclease family)
LIAAFTAGIAALGGETPARADDAASNQQGQVCGGDEIARGTVGKILDGRTFVLDDGREVRLAAIEVGLQDRADPAGGAAAAALTALAAGDQVMLRRAESGLVSNRIASPCAGDLLGREKAAREAKLGLWADPYYEVLDAEMPKDALAHRGRFALVEGKVASVRESGATIYVNFGRRRIGDITVTILKRNERSFAAAGLDLRSLAGRRIRIRGWIEARGGDRAWIEAERPEQIETAD